MSIRARETRTAYLFLAPFLFVFGLFMVYPIFYSLYLSFHRFNIKAGFEEIPIWVVELIRSDDLVRVRLDAKTGTIMSCRSLPGKGAGRAPSNRVVYRGGLREEQEAIHVSFALARDFAVEEATYRTNQPDWRVVETRLEPLSTDWVGLGNYTRLLRDRAFWWSLVVTAFYATLGIPCGIGLSFLLALLLNNNLPGNKFFRSAYFLPVVLDMLAVGIVWTLLYAAGGIIPNLLAQIGLPQFQETGVLGNPLTALPGIIIAMTLKGAGFGMVLFLAAIQNIDPTLYEAAAVDGAGRLQRIWHITIPMVRPVIIFMVVTGVIGALNAFVDVYAMTGGGPSALIPEWVPLLGGSTQGATKVSGYYLYQRFVVNHEYGFGAAIAYVLLAVTVLFTLVNLRFLRKKS